MCVTLNDENTKKPAIAGFFRVKINFEIYKTIN